MKIEFHNIPIQYYMRDFKITSQRNAIKGKFKGILFRIVFGMRVNYCVGGFVVECSNIITE